jgi:hypothetical protein
MKRQNYFKIEKKSEKKSKNIKEHKPIKKLTGYLQFKHLKMMRGM